MEEDCSKIVKIQQYEPTGVKSFALFCPVQYRTWTRLLSAAFWKIIAALKSHMTCYNSFCINLRNLWTVINKFQNCLEGFSYSKVQLNNPTLIMSWNKVQVITGHVTFKSCYIFSKSSWKQSSCLIWYFEYFLGTIQGFLSAAAWETLVNPIYTNENFQRYRC